ncbi:HAUS augmin-like complex subunit 5 isoform X2 [Prionailurus iriomotensis]
MSCGMCIARGMSRRSEETYFASHLLYGHQDSPEARRKLELEATVARLRAEIQELDQSLELMEQETEAQDMAMEQALQSIQDTQRRALLLRAQAGAMRRQQRGLQDPMQRLQNQLKRLQDIERKATVDITFRPLSSASLGLEPVVLGDVRTACTLRTQFLQNLLVPQAKGGSILTPRDDHFGASYQQWLSSVETLLTNHPPGHILASLEHLAEEREAEIRSLCSPDGLQDTEITRSQAPDQPDSSRALPSMVHLIQEGWRDVGMLIAQRGPLLKEHQILTQRLQSLMEEVKKCALESSERQALVLGLRACGLWAELKALRAQSQELEEVAGRRQLLLQELQAKQQRILHWRRLVEETQEQIRLLIKGNSASKTRLCRSPAEVLALLQRKVVPTSEAVAPQSQKLLHCLEEEARHLPHLLLDTLLRHSPGGVTAPAHGPAIHLPAASHVPKELQPHSAEPQIGAACREGSRTAPPKGCLSSSGTSVSPGPAESPVLGSAPHEDQPAPRTIHPGELLQIRAAREKEQKENLGQALKQLENLLKQALERIPELQGVVGDWWEQPGQAALSGELCQGLSLPQWRLRWVQAQGILQQLCR